MLIEDRTTTPSTTLPSRLSTVAKTTNYADIAAATMTKATATDNSTNNKTTNDSTQSPREELLNQLRDYIDKGPIVAMREKILESMGLTEDKLKQLPPEKQQNIEAEIAEKIKELLLKQQGEKSTQQTTLQKMAIYPSVGNSIC